MTNDFERIDLVGTPDRSSLNAEYNTVPCRIQRFLQPSIQAVGYNVVGIDVSSWQGKIDWCKAAEKIHFAFIRAGVGSSTVDPQFSTNKSECEKRGIPYGIYWYMKPDKNPKQTAFSFAAAYNDTNKVLPPWMDSETCAGLNKAEVSNWTAKVDNNFADATDKRPGMYSSPGFANQYYWQTDYQDSLKDRLLWVANWTTANVPEVPYVWSKVNQPRTWTFWQWTSKGKGIDYGMQSVCLDLNYFHYSIAEFNNRFGTNIKPLPGDTTPPPPPDPQPSDHIYLVNVSDMSVRSKPNTGATSLYARAIKGREVEVLNETETNEYVQVRAWMLKRSLKKK